MAPSATEQQARPTTSRTRMSSLFNTIRASIYGSVLLFTVICLAMAGHFQTVLAASDLTRFVPFAIFVCTASLFIFMILVSFSALLRERNPISTRIELASLGLAGVFWLVLGVYLTTSESQDADVECFATPDGTTPLDDEIASFHTDQFQAMYRVLMSFSLMNAALVLLACFALLFLAVRRHRKGDEHMWHGPVTSCAWFNDYGNGGAKPTRGKSVSSSTILPTSTAYTEKPERKASRASASRGGEPRRTGSRRQQPHQEHPSPNPYMNTYAAYQNVPLPSPPRNVRQAYAPSTNASHFEAGGMLNPYSNRQARR